jgi:hypothetical protein
VDTFVLLNIIFYIAMLLCLLALSAILFLSFRDRSRKKKHGVFASPSSSQKLPSSGLSGNEEQDITSYATGDIPKSGHFSADERRMEYRRRGKSPSRVIDGVYNDMNRDGDHPYSDVDRDWDADA